jgi:hypothetical protein
LNEIRRVRRILHNLLGKLWRTGRGGVFKLLNKWLIIAISSPSIMVRGLFIRLLAWARRIFLLVFGDWHYKVILFRGTYSVTSMPMRVCYVGPGDSLYFLPYLLYEDSNYKREDRGECFLWQGPSKVLDFADHVDMTILERNSLLQWTPKSGNWLMSQTCVRMVRDFEAGEGWQQVERTMKKGNRRNVLRIQQGNYTYRISHSETDFTHFYHRMYVPYISARHYEQAYISEKCELRDYFQHGMIMFAMRKGEEAVAACLSMKRGNVLYAIAFGVLEGDFEWVKDGAISALYYYQIKWCLENGYRRFDGGRCHPFIMDGIYQHKKRWGLRPIRDLWDHNEWLLWSPHKSEASIAWFNDHQFVPEVSLMNGVLQQGLVGSHLDSLENGD